MFNMEILSVTPGIHNIDSLAIFITVAGYLIVFSALTLLVFIFIRIAKFQDFMTRMRMRRQKPDLALSKEMLSVSAEENAAIATAVYLFFNEIHDEEKYVMTIKKVSRNYSPWSSKIYSVYNTLKK